MHACSLNRWSSIRQSWKMIGLGCKSGGLAQHCIWQATCCEEVAGRQQGDCANSCSVAIEYVCQALAAEGPCVLHFLAVLLLPCASRNAPRHPPSLGIVTLPHLHATTRMISLTCKSDSTVAKRNRIAVVFLQTNHFS